MTLENRYQCSYCECRFKLEGAFLRHNCKTKQRYVDFKSLIGQNAWTFYKLWMRLKYRSAVNNHETFIKSKFFYTFYKFARYIKIQLIPKPEEYVKLMIILKLAPGYWISDEAYGKYLSHISNKFTPNVLIEITINTLFKIADNNNIKIHEIPSIITPNDIIQLLRKRLLSPWLLLHSPKFIKLIVSSTSPEEKIILENLIKPDYWSAKFKKNPKVVQTVKTYISELEL